MGKVFNNYQDYLNDYNKEHGTNQGARTFKGWLKEKNRMAKLKANKRTYSLYACDFETTNPKEFTSSEILAENKSDITGDLVPDFTPAPNSQVFLSGVVNMSTCDYFLNYENISDTFDTIARETIKEGHKLAYCFYHNLSYDGSYILSWLIKHNFKQTLLIDEKTKQPILKRKQFNAMISGSKFFKIVFYWKGIKLIFLDSLKMLPQALADLGETIGIPKLTETVDYKDFKLDPKHNYPAEWLTYLKRDCDILAQVLNSYFKHEPAARNLKRFTIGAVSYSYIKKEIDKIAGWVTVTDFNFWVKWFRGGLCFPSFKHWGRWVYKPNLIKMVDAVSMYPSRMVEPVPVGKPLKDKPKDTPYTAFYVVEITKATPKQGDLSNLYKPYIFVNGKKAAEQTFLASPFEYVQNLDGSYLYYFVKEEWETVKKLFNLTYKIKEVYYFKLDYVARDIIKNMFKKKQEADRNHQATLKFIAKIKINNIYGKLGQKPSRPLSFYGDLKDIPANYEVLGEKNNPYLKGYNIIRKLKPTDKAQPVHIASYITAKARVNLINQYLKIKEQGGEFLYCDTDSISYIDNPKKPVHLDNIGDNLGDWSYEKDKDGKPLTGDGFLALCPKQYRIVKSGAPYPLKIACAGVKKALMYLIKNQNYNYNLTDILTKTTMINGLYGKVINEDTPFTFKKWKRIIKEKIETPKELYN